MVWFKLNHVSEGGPCSENEKNIASLVQGCSISSALAMEVLQSYTKPFWGDKVILTSNIETSTLHKTLR